LPDTSPDLTDVVVHRITQGLPRELPVGCTVGTCSFPRDGQTLADLMRAAGGVVGEDDRVDPVLS
jgi:urease gamma subunit